MAINMYKDKLNWVIEDTDRNITISGFTELEVLKNYEETIKDLERMNAESV